MTIAADGAVHVDKQSAEAIELSTGGRVISLPASAATVQGYTGHVVIDEAAWIPDVDALWMAIVPTISTRGEYRLSVVSTPGPRAGMFHRLWNNDDPAWSRHRVSIYDAKAGGAPHDIDALRAAVADAATWRAAYECQFVDEAHALLPYDLLRARVDDTLSYPLNARTLFEPGDFYAGYDVGRKHDLSVLIVLQRINRQLRWCGAVELRQAPFDEQFELLAGLLKVRSLRRLAIDQSGLGMQLAEQLVKKHGARVEPITMTAPVKESLASRILAAFQRGDVSIPDHRPLIDDLHSCSGPSPSPATCATPPRGKRAATPTAGRRWRWPSRPPAQHRRERPAPGFPAASSADARISPGTSRPRLPRRPPHPACKFLLGKELRPCRGYAAEVSPKLRFVGKA